MKIAPDGQIEQLLARLGPADRAAEMREHACDTLVVAKWARPAGAGAAHGGAERRAGFHTTGTEVAGRSPAPPGRSYRSGGMDEKKKKTMQKAGLVLGAAGLLLFIVGVKRRYRIDDEREIGPPPPRARKREQEDDEERAEEA